MMRTFFIKIFQLNWSTALFAVKKNITNNVLSYGEILVKEEALLS